MRIKAALASSLAYHPKLIVLDEPFSGLDSLVRDELIEALLERCAGATVMISSHDLAEIETFASHIGYLDGGCLRFSEEMSSLAARFREIEITFDAAAALCPLPGRRAGSPRPRVQPFLRFVDSQFNADSTPRRSAEHFRRRVRCRLTLCPFGPSSFPWRSQPVRPPDRENTQCDKPGIFS